MDLISRINHEFLNSPSREFAVLADSCRHLSLEQRQAWAGILSSAATAEGEEENMVRPLMIFFKEDTALKSYIELHAQDEYRHAQMLREYIQKTFQFQKKKKTITDRIIYDFLFAKLKSLGSSRPLPFLMTLYFYELYAEEFYSQLKKRAAHFELNNLHQFFATIQKDELRHIAGLKALIQIWSERKWRIHPMDWFLTRILMILVRFDVNTRKWAFYNKRLRRNMEVLGLDPEFFANEAARHSRTSFHKLRGLRA